ncbi:MAG: hypothetical protein J1E81_07415 [Eubacterium sp.]|nr:hypothetical protein [Eubacterium sp.]
MPTITNIIDGIALWLNVKVLPNVKGKQEADNDAGYNVVSPTAYSMFIPNRDMTENKDISLYPCVLVQLNEATDYLKEHKGSVSVILHVMVWNPGTHNNETSSENVISPKMKYARNAEGWKDAMMIADYICNQLKAAGDINGHRILYENGIKVEPYKEQNAILDFYPRFYMDIEFTVENAFATTPKPYQQYL